MQSFAINAAFGDLPAYSQSFDGLASRPTQISPEYPRISQGHNHEYSVALSNFLYPLPTNQVALPDLVTPNSPVPTSATPLFGNASNYLTGFQSPFLSPLSDQSAHQEILLSRSSWLDHLQTLPSPLINSEIPLPRFPSTPTFGIKDFLRGKKKTVSFQTVTGDGGQKMFCCPVDGCGKLFTRPYNLSSHTRAHNGERPFGCTIDGCTKLFTRRHDLNRHQRTHSSKEKVHSCEFCEAKFYRLDNLRSHLTIISGIKTCFAKLTD